MILEEDMALLELAEVRDGVEFAVGDYLAELWGEALELDNLFSIKPVFDVCSTNDDVSRIPRADGIDEFVGRRRDEVVE